MYAKFHKNSCPKSGKLGVGGRRKGQGFVTLKRWRRFLNYLNTFKEGAHTFFFLNDSLHNSYIIFIRQM